MALSLGDKINNSQKTRLSSSVANKKQDNRTKNQADEEGAEEGNPAAAEE